MEQIVIKRGMDLTPEKIVAKLSYFYEQTHHLHFNTTSFAEHKALDIWGDFTEFKDKIGELLLGYQAPKRFGIPDPIKVDANVNPVKLMDDVIDFGRKLDDWAQSKNYRDLSNTAQELEGLGAKTKYLLSLK